MFWGEGIHVEIGIMPNYPLLGEKMKNLMIENSAEWNREMPEEKSVIVDGRKGSLYEVEDERYNVMGSIYWFDYGNKTVGIFIEKELSSQTDFKLEDHFRWKL